MLLLRDDLLKSSTGPSRPHLERQHAFSLPTLEDLETEPSGSPSGTTLFDYSSDDSFDPCTFFKYDDIDPY